MNDPLSMSDLLTLPDTPSVTSSPESEGGALRSGSPGGEMSGPYGPEAVPARDSAQPARGEGLPIPGISGPPGSISSASAALQSCLESRLKQRFGTGGSILFRETWRERVTPSGRVYWAHTASGHRISGNGCGSWPSPKVNDDNSDRMGIEATLREWNRPNASRASLPLVAKVLGSWPTPNTPSGGPNTKSTATHTGGMDLEGAATLAAWTTPQAHDTSGRSVGQKEKHGTKHGCGCLVREAMTAPWPSPVANDDNKSPEAHLAMKLRMGERDGTGAQRTAITSLQVMAKTASWPTPMAGTPAQNGNNEAGNNDSSRKTVALVSGPTSEMAPLPRRKIAANSTRPFPAGSWVTGKSGTPARLRERHCRSDGASLHRGIYGGH